MLKISDHGGIFGGGKKITFGTAKANDIISGATVATEDGLITGTIPVRNSENGTGGTTPLHHEALGISGATDGIIHLRPNENNGRIIYDGDVWLSHKDAKFISANIAGGVSMLGKTGTFTNDANATANQILSGNTAYVKGAKVTGSIPSKGAQTFTPSTSNQTIASGQYLSGAQTIVGDADLIASNIISGKNIFGVAGTASISSMGGLQVVRGNFTTYGTDTTTITLGFRPSYLFVKFDLNGATNERHIYHLTPFGNSKGVFEHYSSIGGYKGTIGVTDTGFTAKTNISFVDTQNLEYIALR